MNRWTPAQLKKLNQIYASKPAYITDYELAGRLSGQFHKSPESIRWQLRQLHREPVLEAPKILLLDIETLPIEVLVWGTYKQDIRPVQIQKDWSILCWSAKWLFGNKHFGEVVKPKEAVRRMDESIIEGIWNLVNEADLVITQNGDNFDLKKLNTRFLINGLPKPMYFRSIDTLKILQENFDFTYNKLDWVTDILGIGRKVQTSFEWWDECARGNPVYLNKMLHYNIRDVDLLEELYLKLRPWMNSHPNLGLYALDSKIAHCPACGSLELKWEGKYATPLGLYRAFRCQKCTAIGRNTLKKFAGAKVRN